jgi:predicted N-acetyltransferase YhbS
MPCGTVIVETRAAAHSDGKVHMQKPLTSSPAFRVRPLESSDEVETFFRMNAAVFRHDEDHGLVMARRRRYIEDEPDFHPRQLRGAFLGERYIGGYCLLERRLSLGPARLLTGCIGGVATHPDYRHQGIATALMLDALATARSQQYALLLLHGVPGFYRQFGYTDVFEDAPQHFLLGQDLPELPAGTYTVRPAARGDVASLLACYQRHYCPYPASFAPTRTLRRQEHLLWNGTEATVVPPLVATSPADELHGYLMLARRAGKLSVYEAAADTWHAALALLHAHSSLLDAQGEPQRELAWPLPPADTTFFLLADQCVLRSELTAFPDRGWMARPAHIPALFRALLPLWQRSWRSRPRDVSWSGTLALAVADETCALDVKEEDIQPVAAGLASTATCDVQFSPQSFTRLVFGFRPVSYEMRQVAAHPPAELVPLLDVLFPPGQTWIAGSDFF